MFAGRCVAILCAFASLLSAQPAKTTIQDTIYQADGTPFNGTAVITWRTFQAGDTSNIGMQSLTVPILNGGLYVQLVPNTNATPVNYYTVHYNSDGLEQFTETWAVPPSTTALRVLAIRVTAGSTTGPSGGTGTGTGTGGGTGGQTPILETDVVGLSADLTIRPVKGPGFLPGRSAVINDAGEVEGVAGNSSDCVHVDGTTGPCFDSTQLASFVDSETPGGAVDGTNTSFTLANTPSPAVSLSLFRNGIYQTTGTDFSLSGNVIQFLGGATPQPGDILTATYRLGGTAVGAIHTINAAYPLIGAGALETNLNLSLADSAFLRRGHKTMVIGDSQTGPSTADEPFPTIPANWFGQLAVASQSRVRYWGNAGIAGDTTANMLNRLSTDVIARNPDKVFIEAGYIDINAQVSVANIAANIGTMVNRLKAANILPILCTLPPRLPNDVYGPSPQSTLAIVQLNFQLRQLADAQGIPLVDFYSIVVDPKTGYYQNGYSIDNVNPVMPATRLMAAAAMRALTAVFDDTHPWLPVNDSDGINLIQDPVFVRTPSLWVQTAMTGFPAQLTIVPDPNSPGNTMTLQKTDSGSIDRITGATITTGFSPGDRLAFTGTITAANCESGNLQFDISLQFNPGAMSMYPAYHWAVDIARGQWYVEFSVPPGASSMTPVIQLNQGSGVVTIGHIGVVNLTALGF
jgi:lysophospholipase L1-like esterase